MGNEQVLVSTDESRNKAKYTLFSLLRKPFAHFIYANVMQIQKQRKINRNNISENRNHNN